MNRRVRVTPEAEADIALARSWYEEVAAGLGADFVKEMRAALVHVARHPLSQRAVEGEIRRALIRRFPYAAFFVAHEDEVIVLACFHVHRDPNAWRFRNRSYGP